MQQSHKQKHQVVHRSQPLPPYTTVGQFSYAPATQTTIVTTTTTTTTHFPILRMGPPRNLNELDPKQYPLATLPTPQSLKRFCFDIDGRPTYFREADDPDQAVKDLDKLMEDLREGGGTIKTVEEGEEHVDIPNHMIKTPISTTLPSSAPGDSANRKRPASPVSISEAAQRVATLQKGNKRRQTTRGRQSVAPPITNTPTSSRKNLRSRGVASSPGLQLGDNDFSTSQASRAAARPIHQQVSQVQQIRTIFSPGRLTSSQQQQQETPLTLSPQLAPTNLHIPVDESIPITPSISQQGMQIEDALTDVVMETVGTPTSETMAVSPRASREGSSTLSVEQPLSLPSPSLSPVTAALAHGNSGYFSPSGGEEEINLPFELASANAHDVVNDLQLVRSPTREIRHSGRQHSPGGLMDIPNMIDSFDLMPQQVQSYVLYQLLRRCSKSTLQMVASVVNPALKCDFISLLPLELSLNVIKYLDVQSLCSAAQVCKRWRVIIDSDEWTWKRRFEADGYKLEEGELERAVNEGWGYQDPKGNDDYERDIKANLQPSKFITVTASSTPRVQKRKTRAMVKQQKKKQESVDKLGKDEFNELISELSNNEWPLGALETSEALTHIMGLPSLRILHLYKSIYRRHHLIRQSWLKPEMKPRHIAFRGHQRHVVTCLQFDTDKILTGSDDNNINVYDTNTGSLRRTLVGHEGGVWALQYEGNTLVSGSTDRSVRVWDIQKGECTQIFHGHTSTVRCLQIVMPTKIGVGPDGKDKIMPKVPLIITGSRDSTLRIWKLPQHGDAPYLPESNSPDTANNPYFVRILQGHQHSVRAIAVHGDTLVSGSYDYTVRVWRISTGETIHRLTGHTQKVYSVVLDTKRNRCISGSMDNSVKVWSLDTGSLLFSLEGHSSLVGLLDLSHDHLVSAAADSTLRIWDPETGQCKHILSAHTGAITCFQHDGHKVISGSDGTLKMWNVRTGQFIRDLLTDLSGVWQVKFNERRCVAAVQRDSVTYIEVLDFGAARDGLFEGKLGRRIVVDAQGLEIPDGLAARAEGM
ncbi:WD40-repeat-containing domain protein [Kalaharituber pfeilii]|nr:WD40-repeat-containing domain protein [Kalaharituber pfeilii]